MKRYIVISGILLLIGLTVSVSLGIKLKKMDITYNKVAVVVSDVEVIAPKYDKSYTEYIIKVRENGIEKKLHNVKRGFSYHVGKVVEVLEADGVLYEDEDGVRIGSSMADYYFASLRVDLFLLFLFLCSIIVHRRKKG